MADQGFSKQVRILRRIDFTRVYERRCSIADDVLIVYGCESDQEFARLGLTVSRKVGNAVVRNRWKRVMREAFRLQRTELPPNLDLVVSPRYGVEPTLSSVQKSLRNLALRLEKKLSRKQARQ